MQDEQYDRLKKARMRKGFATAADAARAYGWNLNTYASHENGNRGLSKAAAERYARALSVSVGWLLTGENPPKWLNDNDLPSNVRPMRPIPQFTMAEASAFTSETFEEHLARAKIFSSIGIAPDLGARVFEVILDDESMAPDFRTNEFIVADPDRAANPGEFVLAVIAEQAVFRRLVIAGYRDDRTPLYQLEPLNTGWPVLPVNDGDWIVGKVVRHTREI